MFLSLRAVSRPHLFEAARALIGDDEPRGPALVVAQSAVEVAFETTIDFALQMRSVHDPLREWVSTTAVRSWSPTSDHVKTLWAALTGDTITDAASWSAYRTGVKLRNDFVHRAAAVARDDAEAFVDAAEQLVEHVVHVMVDTFPDPV